MDQPSLLDRHGLEQLEADHSLRIGNAIATTSVSLSSCLTIRRSTDRTVTKAQAAVIPVTKLPLRSAMKKGLFAGVFMSLASCLCTKILTVGVETFSVAIAVARAVLLDRKSVV